MNKNELLEQVKLALPSIHGWCCFSKAEALIENIIEKTPEICVELGVYGGSSLLPQALALKYNQKGMLYGIDPWTNDAALEEMKEQKNVEWWAKLNLDEIYHHCQTNIIKYNVEKYCTIIKNKAENVVNQFQDNTIDMLHIDGNHSEALSYKDATLYLPKVKKGGIIFFDDIWWTEENSVTTRKAIIFLLNNCKKINIINDCMILQKN